jgi:hypothetical protein
MSENSKRDQGPTHGSHLPLTSITVRYLGYQIDRLLLPVLLRISLNAGFCSSWYLETIIVPC